jgi:hypothetical protein
MTALALLATPVWAQGEEPKEEEVGDGEVVEMPVGFVYTPAGRIARGERDAPTAFVRLREGGTLEVKPGEEWKGTTLNELAKVLKEFAETRDRELRKDGKSAYETVAGGARVSRLFVSLDVEPTVPWQHVQWLMMAAAEQKYWKLELTDGTRKMLVFLPADRGVNALPKEPPHEIRIPVHAVARREKEGKWGDVPVLRPVEVRYKIGSEEIADLTEVKHYIRMAHKAVKDTPGAEISGEVKAGNKVPFSKMLDLLDAFEAAGLEAMSFHGNAPPAPEIRDAPRLPYPLKNYAVAD